MNGSDCPTGARPPIHETIGRRDADDITSLPAVLRRTSLGAVVAGAIVAISAQILFTVAGIAIGATALDARFEPTAQVQNGLDVTAAAWWLVTGTLSLMIGGMVVGRFAGITRSLDLLLHGLTMWAVTAVVGFAIVTSAGTSLLYGTNINAAYTGAAAANSNTAERPHDTSLVSHRERDGVVAKQTDNIVDREIALSYVRRASWWSLAALVIGIGASLAGSWLAAPDRIVMRAPSAG